MATSVDKRVYPTTRRKLDDNSEVKYCLRDKK